MAGRLEGKVAIITGGTSGIGLRSAEVFAEEGACVLIAARREKEGHEIAARLGGSVEFLKTDVCLEADVKAMVAYAVDRFGRLDCLFNNAGSPAPTGSISSIPLEGYEKALSVLLGGVLLGMKHAAPVMCRQGSGSIINTGSVAGVLAGYGSSMVYGTAKAAVIHLTRLVAMELGESNVRVNCISPGGIATGIFGKAAGLPIDQAEKTAEAVKQVLAGYQVWRNLPTYVPWELMGLSAAAALWAAARRRWTALVSLGWAAVLIVLPAGRLIRLPGANYLQHFAIQIALYMPVSLLAGWLLGEVAGRLSRGAWGVAAVLAATVLAAGWGGWDQSNIVEPGIYRMVFRLKTFLCLYSEGSSHNHPN